VFNFDVDDPRQVLIPDNFFMLCKHSPEAKSHAVRTAKAARTAYGVQNMLEYLNKIGALDRQLTAEEQQMVCDINWWAQHEAPHEDILNYVKSIPDDVLFQEEPNGYVC
jgi:hypothetical protein